MTGSQKGNQPEMKVDPEHYPVIIILMLVLSTILGLALGFRPEHGGGEHNLRLAAELLI